MISTQSPGLKRRTESHTARSTVRVMSFSIALTPLAKEALSRDHLKVAVANHAAIMDFNAICPILKPAITATRWNEARIAGGRDAHRFGR